MFCVPALGWVIWWLMAPPSLQLFQAYRTLLVTGNSGLSTLMVCCDPPVQEKACGRNQKFVEPSTKACSPGNSVVFGPVINPPMMVTGDVVKSAWVPVIEP